MTETDRRCPPADAPGPVTLPSNVRIGTEARGIEAVEASIRRHGSTYLERTFTEQEVQSCGGYGAEPHLLAPGLAARLCAKEATLKVLRPTAIIPERRDIDVVSGAGGWLGLVLTGAARQLADQRGVVDLQVSISHDGAVATATVIAVENPPDGSG